MRFVRTAQPVVQGSEVRPQRARNARKQTSDEPQQGDRCDSVYSVQSVVQCLRKGGFTTESTEGTECNQRRTAAREESDSGYFVQSVVQWLRIGGFTTECTECMETDLRRTAARIQVRLCAFCAICGSMSEDRRFDHGEHRADFVESWFLERGRSVGYLLHDEANRLGCLVIRQYAEFPCAP